MGKAHPEAELMGATGIVSAEYKPVLTERRLFAVICGRKTVFIVALAWRVHDVQVLFTGYTYSMLYIPVAAETAGLVYSDLAGEIIIVAHDNLFKMKSPSGKGRLLQIVFSVLLAGQIHTHGPATSRSICLMAIKKAPPNDGADRWLSIWHKGRSEKPSQ